MIADRYTVCECGLHAVPIGEEVFTVSGQIFCAECKALSERKTAREACGQITSKKHWKDEKKRQKQNHQGVPLNGQPQEPRTRIPVTTGVAE